MGKIHRCFKFFFHIALFAAFSYLLNQKPIRPIKKIERFLGDMKHILLWTKFTGVQQEGQQQLINNKCLYLNCYLTNNRSLLGDLRYFDAIIFNVKDLDKTSSDLPTMRTAVQKYVFAANDSSEDYPVCNSIYDGYFNWTWSYRLDSLIPYSYITVYNVNHEELGIDLEWKKDMDPIDPRLRSMLQSKSKAAAVFLDKCESSSKREVFIKELQKELTKYNLTVDVYGKCGNFRCGRKNINSFYYKLKTTYYFYLALEESIAPDYITANILTGYKNNAVPIVNSGADYDRMIPPKSYLDAGKLGASLLAKTMHQIIQNKEWYYDFFRWRNHYVVKKTNGMDFCTLCEIMNNPSWLSARLNLKILRKWWNPYYETRCPKREHFIF